MWTLEEGVHFVRELEKALRPLGYWTALGGGTLYNGVSLHDLDVVVMPLSDNYDGTKAEAMLNYLKDRFTLKMAGKSYENAYHVILQTTLLGERKLDLFLPNELRYDVQRMLGVKSAPTLKTNLGLNW